MSSQDPTESIRRGLVELGIPAADLAAVLASGGQVWSTAELTTEFEVIGFMAPYVVARRLADGQRGTLEFTHSPRFYFGWAPDETPDKRASHNAEDALRGR
jgi:hypothetical protein